MNRPAGRAGAAVIGLLVFSHWLLDFVTHMPDLELWFGGPRIGLGLWENRPASFDIEVALPAAGMAAYALRTAARNGLGRAMPFVIVLVGTAAQVFANWGPPPSGPDVAATTALVAYAVFAGLAALSDATRRTRQHPAS